MLSVPIVFVDLETDGLREPWLPGGRRIWELGVIRREADGSETEYQRFIRLDDLQPDLERSREALEIGSFHRRHPELNPAAPADGLCTYLEAAELLAKLTADQPLWVGVVPYFDASSVLHLLHTTGVLPADAPDVPWDFRLVCAVTLAMGRSGASPTAPAAEISLALGIDQAAYQIHSALEDARWTRDLYDAVRRAAALSEGSRARGL